MYQYLEQIKKGDTVTYGSGDNRKYVVQDDSKGFLHIVVISEVDGVRKKRKIALKNIDVWFEYGSHPDWIFNGWWKIYPDYEVFKQYADNEKLAA